LRCHGPPRPRGRPPPKLAQGRFFASPGARLVKLATQIAENSRGSRRRFSINASRAKLAQPLDLTLATHALAEMLLYKRKLVLVQGPVHEPRQQHIGYFVRCGIEW
jgi:hypothetical protein